MPMQQVHRKLLHRQRGKIRQIVRKIRQPRQHRVPCRVKALQRPQEVCPFRCRTRWHYRAYRFTQGIQPGRNAACPVLHDADERRPRLQQRFFLRRPLRTFAATLRVPRHRLWPVQGQIRRRFAAKSEANFGECRKLVAVARMVSTDLAQRPFAASGDDVA